MTVRIEKKGKVWTVIHSRPEAKNAMDPESAEGAAGTARFAPGLGRHGDFREI